MSLNERVIIYYGNRGPKTELRTEGEFVGMSPPKKKNCMCILRRLESKNWITIALKPYQWAVA